MIATAILVILIVLILYWKGSSIFVSLFSGAMIAAFALVTTTLTARITAPASTVEQQHLYLIAAFAVIMFAVGYLLNVSLYSYRSHSHDALYSIVMGILFSGLIMTIGKAVGFYDLFDIPAAISVAFEHQYAIFGWIAANIGANWFLRR